MLTMVLALWENFWWKIFPKIRIEFLEDSVFFLLIFENNSKSLGETSGLSLSQTWLWLLVDGQRESLSRSKLAGGGQEGGEERVMLEV